MNDNFDNIIVPIPERFLSALWLKYGKSVASVAVLFNSGTGEVITITAVTTKHKAIMWSDAVYDYINDYVLSNLHIDRSAHEVGLKNLLS